MQRVLKWHPYPDTCPEKAGSYLVTLKRPHAGHYIQIRHWSGVNWGQTNDVAAWMELPNTYKGIGYAGPKASR